MHVPAQHYRAVVRECANNDPGVCARMLAYRGFVHEGGGHDVVVLADLEFCFFSGECLQVLGAECNRKSALWGYIVTCEGKMLYLHNRNSEPIAAIRPKPNTPLIIQQQK